MAVHDGFLQFLTDFRSSEKDLQFFLDQLPIPLMLCRGWEIIFFNSASASVVPDLYLPSLIGGNALSFVDDPDRKFIADHLDKYPSGDSYRFNLKVRTKEIVVDLSTLSRSITLGTTTYLIIAFQDLSRLSVREKSLFQLVLDTFPLNGRQLYRSMISSLARNYDLDGAALIQYSRNASGLPIVVTIAGILDGDDLPAHSYDLENSLAHQLQERGILIVEKDLSSACPNNAFVEDNQFEAFVGVHLRTGMANDLGLYVVSRKPITDTAGITFVLNICGVRLLSEYITSESRKKAEQQERDNRLLVEQSADPMFVLDSQGLILMANNRAVDLTQYPKNELNDLFKLISIEHHHFFRSFFQKSYGVLNHSNVTITRKDSSRVYCDLSGVILSDGRIQLNIRDNTEKMLTDIALKQSEEKYRSIFDNASDAIYLSDWKTGRILDCNHSFIRLVGHSRDFILQSTHFDLIRAEDRERFTKIFEYIKHKRSLEKHPLKFRVTIVNDRGHFTPLEIAFTLLKKNDNQLVVGIIRDLTASYQAIEEHRKHLQTLSMLHVVVVELDEELRIRFINNPIAKFMPASGKGMHGLYFPEVASDDFRWYVQVTLEELLKTRKTATIRFPVLSAKTGMDWYEAEFVIVRDRTSHARIRGLIKDVTFEYIVEKQTYFMSNTDMLTSLPNRNRLEEELFRAILRSDRTGKRLAVGFIDLDHFFDVNDLLGHRLGDLAIAIFAEKLRTFPQIERMIYRWGGDQFVFIMEGIEDLSVVRKLLNDIREGVREPMTIEEQAIHVTCTVGVAVYPDDAQTIDGLFGNADRALQYGKKTGRFQFLLAQDIAHSSSATDRMKIRTRLSVAVNNNLIVPYFQPIYDLQEGRIAAMEALARLPDTEGFARVGPEVFIPVAEDLGIIEELSDVIVTEAVEFQKRLLGMGYDLRLSVNVSRRMLYSDRLMDSFNSLLEKTGADPKRICLEITETLAMLDIKNASERLHDLKNLGFLIAIDDFGTGYSTLGQLYEIPVDELKIDKLFIRRIHSHEGQRIAEAIVNMARALQLEIVAEGVEDMETLYILRNMGVRYIQGYLFSVPVNRQEFEIQIKNGFNVIV